MGFNVNKMKVNLKLATNRIRLLQQKKISIGQQQRREIATLLQDGKTASAQVRVEHIIREDYNSEAMEMLELMCDLLLARVGLLAEIKYCDESIQEAVHTILYASQRSEIKELKTVRDLLAAKFGRDFAEAAINNRMGLVNPRVVQRLKVQAPDPMLVNSYLSEIAKTFAVDWKPPATVDILGLNEVPPMLQAVATQQVHAVLEPRFTPVNNSTMAPTITTTSTTASSSVPVKYTPPSAETASAPVKHTAAPQTTTATNPNVPTIPRLPGDEDDYAVQYSQPASNSISSGKEKALPDPFPTVPQSSAAAVAPPPPPAEPEPVDNDADETPDFDALARRFEELKRRK